MQSDELLARLSEAARLRVVVVLEHGAVLRVEVLLDEQLALLAVPDLVEGGQSGDALVESLAPRAELGDAVRHHMGVFGVRLLVDRGHVPRRRPERLRSTGDLAAHVRGVDDFSTNLHYTLLGAT